MAMQYGRTSFTADGATALLKVKDVPPVYAPMAITAGVQGSVVVQATVNERGRVTEARIVESIPMLNQAVIDAVKQWEFEPVRVAGAPAQVAIVVTANFTLPR
jgi:protein TonB